MHALSIELVGLARGVDPRRGRRPSGPASPRAAASSPTASRAAPSAISVEVEAVSVSRPSNDAGRPSRLAEPVDDDALELGADRRGPPQHRVLAEGGGEHLAEDPGPRAPSCAK